MDRAPAAPYVAGGAPTLCAVPTLDRFSHRVVGRAMEVSGSIPDDRHGGTPMPETYGEACENCPYRRCNPHYQPPGAPLSMERNSGRMLLVLQAPGVDEWHCRRPAISQSPHSAAARIRNSIDRLGRTRADYSITNAVQCYPGCRRTNGRDKRPRKSARRACAAWLRVDILCHTWDRVVIFGRSAECSVREIFGDCCPDHVTFLKHPSGGLPNCELDAALDCIPRAER